LLVRFEGRILPLDLDMALEWGFVSAATESRGKSAPVVDALLAATAIVHNLTLVTRNDKDFAGFPVKVLNPWNHGNGFSGYVGEFDLKP
jgi:predicted nucleic acid-binding protein